MFRLMKQYVKILDRKSSEEFEYVKAKFPKITEGKLKGVISVGPQIKEQLHQNCCDQVNG